MAVGFGAKFLVKVFLAVGFFATVFFELGGVVLEEVFLTVLFFSEEGLFLLAFFLEGEALAAVFLFVLAGALRVLVLVVDMCGMNFGRG